MQWLEIKIDTEPTRLDSLVEELEALGVEGVQIEDEAQYADFLENNTQYWDYIDEELEEKIKDVCRVTFYLESGEKGEAELEKLENTLVNERFSVKTVQDEDWENNWKQYYKPIAVGDRLVIVPEWEDYTHSQRKVLRLDPGLIFGTGMHATTQMCLRAIEPLAESAERVLDLGCGSGILAIAALLLGAKTATGCDIDEKAPAVVMENAALNGIGADRLSVFAGDVLTDARVRGEKFNLVLANIVADVIIALSAGVRGFLAEGGRFICSGIIDGREGEVIAALEAAGLEVLERYKQDNWHAFLCRSKGDI